MKIKVIIILFVLLVGGLFIWRVEGDRAFLPARVNADMTVRLFSNQAPVRGAVPFANTSQSHINPARLYRQYCAACHGEQGVPPPYLAHYPGMPQITALNPTPSDCATWPESVARGRGAMPSYADILTDHQREALLQYLPTMGSCASTVSVQRSIRAVTPGQELSTPHGAIVSVAWGKVVAGFVVSLVVGVYFVRYLVPLCRGEWGNKSFARLLAGTMVPAAVAMLIGTWLWKSAGYALAAFAFAAGMLVDILKLRGRIAPYQGALYTVSLAVVAYAVAVPWLVGSYLPGKTASVWWQVGHACCLGVLILLAFLPHMRPMSTAPMRVRCAAVALLVLAGAHVLLSCEW